MLAALVSAVLLAGSPGLEDLAAYQAAANQAGRDPEAHVRLALWCESRGLKSERIKHLSIALLVDPGNARARGLLGQVEDGARWRKPEQVADRIQSDAERTALLAEYNTRRAQAARTQEAQYRLALWCESRGLKAEAEAHFTVVTQLPTVPASSRTGLARIVEPVRATDYRPSAWRHLGCRYFNGRWMSDSRIAEEKAADRAQKLADRRWEPLLAKWAVWLEQPGAARVRAKERLAQVADPLALPSIWRCLVASGRPDRQLAAAQVLGQIDGSDASRALVTLAIDGASDEVCRVAAETLIHRDPRDVVDPLIARLRRPATFQATPVTGVGGSGALLIETEHYNLVRRYEAPDVPSDSRNVLRGERALPVAGPGQADRLAAQAGRLSAAEHNLFEASRAAVTAERQLENDLERVRQLNGEILRGNDRIRVILTALTGQDFGNDREAWQRWWTDEQGYSYQSPEPKAKPTFEQNVPIVYQPRFMPIPTHHSCFGAGTRVQTLTGPRPIETIEVGDQVLTQQTRTGALEYRPILAVHHNRPTRTLRVRLGDDAIVATGIHRFWKAGQGWVMARDLRPGDEIRTLKGRVRVESVETLEVQPVFNLDVADNHDFFVGAVGALVHDNSRVAPVVDPFDAAPVLAASAGGFTPIGGGSQ